MLRNVEPLEVVVRRHPVRSAGIGELAPMIPDIPGNALQKSLYTLQGEARTMPLSVLNWTTSPSTSRRGCESVIISYRREIGPRSRIRLPVYVPGPSNGENEVSVILYLDAAKPTPDIEVAMNRHPLDLGAIADGRVTARARLDGLVGGDNLLEIRTRTETSRRLRDALLDFTITG